MAPSWKISMKYTNWGTLGRRQWSSRSIKNFSFPQDSFWKALISRYLNLGFALLWSEHCSFSKQKLCCFLPVAYNPHILIKLQMNISGYVCTGILLNLFSACEKNRVRAVIKMSDWKQMSDCRLRRQRLKCEVRTMIKPWTLNRWGAFIQLHNPTLPPPLITGSTMKPHSEMILPGDLEKPTASPSI